MEAKHTPEMDTPEQAAIRAKRGWLCNWTGGHCPRGCGTPCTYQTDRSLVGGGVERREYNAGTEFAAADKATGAGQ